MKTSAALFYTAGALILPALTGCGGSSSSNTNAPTLTPRSVSTTLSDGLTGTLTEDRIAVAKGGTVNYTLTLSNQTTQPITYQPFISPDLTVKDPAGNVTYPTVISNAVGIGPSTTLAPGQSSVYDTEAVGGSGIGGYSATGQYTAQASFGVVQGGTATSSGTDIFATAGPLPVTVQ
jgi:hypothetical protein